VTTIFEQAGADGQVIDLHGATWTEPRPSGGGQAKDRPACCPACARDDEWADSLGGYSSDQYIALYREAVEFAGEGGTTQYLDMCQSLDREHAATPGKWLAEAIELVAARRADAAAAAVLERVNEIALAVDQLAEDPRLADGPDFSTRPPMGRAEVDVELRAALGLAVRAPTVYEAMLPPVGDLARAIGVKS
jgi:hypothetical protein